eukprot:TRINITY_DN7916_c0_g1_i1.p1 TRINITY_DN7916_c0_g1~~TRINITY_DN7916_c0_g1_i1.p1  ORF type:complete len:219 (+),score=36.15 TRINITY_DN7916_c0_g1_i1:120-776(+)
MAIIDLCKPSGKGAGKVARVFAIITVIACIACGISSFFNTGSLFWIGILTIITGVLVLLLEIPLLLGCCCNVCVRIHNKLTFVNRTLFRGIFYILISAANFPGATVCIISGCFLVFTGFLYIMAHVQGDNGTEQELEKGVEHLPTAAAVAAASQAVQAGPPAGAFGGAVVQAALTPTSDNPFAGAATQLASPTGANPFGSNTVDPSNPWASGQQVSQV